MSGRYRSIGYDEFKAWMDNIGFVQVEFPGMEFTFERKVNCASTKDRLDRFAIRIMSSVDRRTLESRDVGGDAIRILLVDTIDPQDNKIVETWTVHRTMNAHQNVVQRARDAWGYVAQHPEHHCSCGCLMALRAPRKGGKQFKPFLGCTGFPVCKETKAAA